MTLTASRRLPGIRFETRPPVLDDALPRMDVAGFVGFAASGPVDVPVAIEDPAQFAAIFGADAPLAWDDARGEQVYAYLAPAVRAFFRNGGRRCWVVRVAGADAASDVFELGGIAGVDIEPARRPPHRYEPAVLRASSPGSWADELSLSTRVSATTVRYDAVDLVARRLDASVARRDELTAGDVLRLRFAGLPWTLLIVVESVEPSSAPGRGAERLAVRWAESFWLRPAALAGDVAGWVSYLAAAANVASISATLVAADGDGRATVRLALDGRPPLPRLGSTLHSVFAGVRVEIEVDAVEASAAGDVISGPATAIQVSRPSAVPQALAAGVAERLELELRIDGADGAPSVLSGLGFAPAHPRWVGALLDDAQRLAPGASDAPPSAGHSLAGPRQPPSYYLPFADALRAGRALTALRPPGHARRRDGLDAFDASAFVDADLASSGPAHLIEAADRLREAPARALRGIHALLDNEEVTLVAVPDGVHRRWAPGGAASAPRPVAAAPRPPADESRFRACAQRIPAAPVLSLAGEAGGGAFTLAWTATDVAGATYELQESAEPDLAEAQAIYAGSARTYEVRDRPPGSIRYYQVRATAGDWSNRLLVRTAPDPRDVLEPAAAYDPAPLVELQLALLRMCAARGDMLAVLALPGHYRARGAVAHVAALEAAGRGPDVPAGRDPILGFGALYHPWLHASEPEGPAALRLLPPDGAATGVIASRARRRGAWVAPANEPLRDVVALAPHIAAGDRQGLQDAQVNLVRQEPEGFLWLAADTLSGEDDVRPIGVRRLLQSLRRLAVSEGAAMAFEVNDDVSRRAVRRTFQARLGRMFELGAFAGRTADEGFRVDTPVAAGDLDAGRLVVELRVAPARALAYLVVRLVSAGAGVRVEGR